MTILARDRIDRARRYGYIRFWNAPPAYQAAIMESEHSSIEDTKRSIVDEFSLFDGWVERYEYIVELGRNLTGLPEECRTEQYRVKGCQSQVWFRAREAGGRVFFEADSDAMIVRGLIALLLRVYSGRTPSEILATTPEFLDAIELGSHLSGNRANGLAAMVNHIQGYARSFGGVHATLESEKVG
jgi:cysteine desulfuration protein SufE